MNVIAGAPHAPSAELSHRRLVSGLIISLLLHALVLSLHFGVAGLGLAPSSSPVSPPLSPPIDVRLTPSVTAVTPPAATPVPVPPAPAVSADASAAPTPPKGMRLVDPRPPEPVVAEAPPILSKPTSAAKRRPSRRVSTPLHSAEPEVQRVIAQDQIVNDFVIASPKPEEAEQKTVDPTDAQHGGEATDTMAQSSGKEDKEIERARELAAQKRIEEQEEKEAQARAAAQAAREEAARLAQAEQARAQEQAQQERVAREQAQERLAQERQQQERLAQERVEAERQTQERVAQERQQQERVQQERVAQERQQRERLDQERLQQERVQQERVQQERVAQERLRQERLQQEQLQQERARLERLAEERVQQERLAKERAQQEEALVQKKLAEQRAVQERVAQERAAQERATQERAAQERATQERAAQERVAQERAAQERAAQERAAQERVAQERAAQERVAQERAAQERVAQERAAAERAASERAARDRAAQEAADRAARERALAQAGPGGAGNADPLGGRGAGAGSPTASVPKDILGSPAANRAREMLKGLDLLKGDPPAQRMRDPRRAVVSNNERDVPLRLYVESWRQKIERNGVVSYPRAWADAQRTDALVSVSVRSDGSVEEVTILRSSGRPDMDEAIRRIVRVNARYSAFPPNIASRYDVIDIRRVWRFDDALKLLEEIP